MPRPLQLRPERGLSRWHSGPTSPTTPGARRSPRGDQFYFGNEHGSGVDRAWRAVVHPITMLTSRKGGPIVLVVVFLLLASTFFSSSTPASILPNLDTSRQESGEGSSQDGYFEKYMGYMPEVVRNAPNLWKPRPEEEPVQALTREKPNMDLQRADGRLLILPPEGNATTGVQGREHPIPKLTKLAKFKWDNIRNRQSKTFKEAVLEYKRRYGRVPPKGFDKWYAWARENDIVLIDEYDLVEHDLHPHRAFSPASFRSRIQDAESYFDFGFRIVIEDGRFSREGRDKEHGRAYAVEELVRPFARYLPDMKAWVRLHDTAAIYRTWEETERLKKLADEGKYEDDDDGRNPYQKLKKTHPDVFVATCPPDSAMRQEGFEFGKASFHKDAGYIIPHPPPESLGTFIGLDLRKYMDVCDSPSYRHTHASTSFTFPIPGPNFPLMTAGVMARFGDVRTVIPEQFNEENPSDTPWEDRTDLRLVWRGQTSGPVWLKQWPWRTTQRARLHLLSHQRDGERAILLADPENGDVVKERVFSNDVLNDQFLDTGMVGPPVQCIEEDGTCAEMYEVFDNFDERLTFEEQDKYKFALDVDGNSWSGRFKRLMSSSALVLKATVFTEPWADWAVPWYHYVPLQVDYSDLWNILAFFRGAPGSGEGAHDELAKEIALNGKEWQKRHYRWEDIQSYEFRLLLEWARLYNDGNMDFEGAVDVEPTLS